MASTSTTTPSEPPAPSRTDANAGREEGLPPPPSPVKCTFQSVADLFTQLDNHNHEVVEVHHVTVPNYLAIKDARKETGKEFKIFLYLPATQTLLLTIPRAPREVLHRRLGFLVISHAAEMGLDEELLDVGQQTVNSGKDASNTSDAASVPGDGEGEGDSVFVPVSARGEAGFPSLVIETAWSQPWTDLHEKARWWFEISGGDVRTVLLVKFETDHDLIKLEKWKQTESPERPGATQTRAHESGSSVPQCVHKVTISQRPGITLHHPKRWEPSSYEISNGDLILDFQDIFLRDPVPPEQDVIFDKATLQQFAVRAWRSVWYHIRQ